MRSQVFFILLLGLLSQKLSAQELIRGELELEPECGTKAMVWLSHDVSNKEKELLLHTLVPHQGSYAFSVSAGIYQAWVTSPQGCEKEFREIKVESGNNIELNIRLQK